VVLCQLRLLPFDTKLFLTGSKGELDVIKHILCSIALLMTVSVLFLESRVGAQDAAPSVANKQIGDDYKPLTDEDIQMMRKDIRSQRKQIIAANLKLTDSEAEKFWPVYEQYISDLVKINATKYRLIKQYVQSRGALTDSEAENAPTQWVSVDQSVAELRKKYIPTFRKVLSPKNTALFYQLDRRVQLIIDLQLAAALPMIEP
jgi:Spy/CpxP family protein refolding chaperone